MSKFNHIRKIKMYAANPEVWDLPWNKGKKQGHHHYVFNTCIGQNGTCTLTKIVKTDGGWKAYKDYKLVAKAPSLTKLDAALTAAYAHLN